MTRSSSALAGWGAVQVKAYRVHLRYHQGRWATRHGTGGRAGDPAFDPARRGTRQTLRLHDDLARNGFDRCGEWAITLGEGTPADHVAALPITAWLPFTIRQTAAEQRAGEASGQRQGR